MLYVSYFALLCFKFMNWKLKQTHNLKLDSLNNHCSLENIDKYKLQTNMSSADAYTVLNAACTVSPLMDFFIDQIHTVTVVGGTSSF